MLTFVTKPVHIARRAPMHQFPSVCGKNSDKKLIQFWKSIAASNIKLGQSQGGLTANIKLHFFAEKHLKLTEPNHGTGSSTSMQTGIPFLISIALSSHIFVTPFYSAWSYMIYVNITFGSQPFSMMSFSMISWITCVPKIILSEPQCRDLSLGVHVFEQASQRTSKTLNLGFGS